MSMKITMIGCSGTGKTCYLYGTYARMLDGVSGFIFSPSEWNEGIELTNIWYSLFEPEARWPVGSVESKDYQFDIFYEGQKLGEFTWLDYRGGLLDSARQGDTQNDIDQFRQRCSNSDALLVCIPADLIVNACSTESATRLMAEKMFVRYKTILMQMPKLAKTPVVLMITKGDLMTNKGVFRNGIAKLKEKASLPKSMGNIWLRQIAKCMI